MANLQQMQAELLLQAMAKMLNADLTTLLNAANREEVEAGWPWDFLFSNYVLYSAAPQSTGTITVTQGSAIVTGAGTSFAAVANAQSFVNIGGSNISIPIASIQSTTQLTLTSPYMGANISGTSYSLSTNVYSVIGFQEVYNVRQIIDLEKTSREQLNLMDPARIATGGAPSVQWAPAGFDSAGNIQIELWEVPSAAYPYVCEGKLAAATMVNPTDLPQIPSAVIMNKCLWKTALACYMSNGNPKYNDIANKFESVYRDELDKAKVADSRRQQQRYITSPDRRLGLDIIATHDFEGTYPGL